MVKRVVPNGMLLLDAAFDDMWVALSILSKHKENCFCILVFQDIQQLWCIIGTGAVIEGQRDDIFSRFPMGYGSKPHKIAECISDESA